MTIKAVIFDLGGVIVRTEHYAPRQALANDLGLNLDALEELVFTGESGDHAQLGQITAEEHFENIRRQLGLPPARMQSFQDSFWAGDVLDWDLVNYIRSLHPRYRTALLSNAFSTLRSLITDVWKFADAFDAMVISAEVGLMKPDERIYRLALERLEVLPGEAVFVDDIGRNIDGARRAGLNAIRFKERQQVYRELDELLNGSGNGR